MNAKLAIAGCGLAVVAVLMLLAAALGHRTGLVVLPTAFVLLRWGVYLGGAGAVLSLLAVLLMLMRPAAQRQGLRAAVVGLALGSALFGFVANQYYQARAVPVIHDITTD